VGEAAHTITGSVEASAKASAMSVTFRLKATVRSGAPAGGGTAEKK
jgi:hypothetical protein